MAYIGVQPSEQLSALPSVNTFIGNGTSNTFTLSRAVNGNYDASLEVFVSNVQQQPSVSYSVFGKTLQFTETPDLNEAIYVIFRDYPVSPYFTLPPGAIKPEAIDALSITTDKLADGAVTTVKLAATAVTTAILANTSVTTEKIANASVTTDILANASVTTDILANTSVTTEKIADASVTTEKIANASVTTEKIANSGVTAATYGNATLVPRFVVGSDGRITSAANVNLQVPDSGVTAATYGSATLVPRFVVGSDGRITSASNVVIAASDVNNITGNVRITGNLRPDIYLETFSNVALSAGNIILNLGNATVFRSVVTGVANVILQNPPPANVGYSLVLQLYQTGSYAITWPTAIQWPSNIAPTLSSTNGYVDTIALYTVDGGVNYYGTSILGQF